MIAHSIMKVILFVALLVTGTLAEIQLSPAMTEVARKALQNPDMYDGDMAGIELNEERNAIVGNTYRWPNAVVPYVIDNSLANQKNLIIAGMNDYYRNTCVRFVPRTNEYNYVNIFYGNGCYSHVGRTGGQQPLSLGYGCLFVGTVVHELGHAIGFYHEQSRSDRDQYLTIYLNNVAENMRNNFFKLAPNQNILYNGFDYHSIMIYGNKSFSMNGYDTMVAKNGQQLSDPFNKNGMTWADIERVNKMYNCR